MTDSPAPFDRDRIRLTVHDLAQHGVMVGTSSWKYPGWLGQLYSPERYTYRGQFAQSRFDRLCLAEYAETFPTVSVDAAYYRFPDPSFLDGLMAPVPETFQFSFKVTDEITVKRFPRLPRFGERAGTANPNFLNAELFTSAFLGPLESHRHRVGVVMFEFSKFYPSDFARGREFVAALDDFLGRLPNGWRYGVEIRNASFLHPDYYEVLTRHQVAPVFNSWQAMPPLADQLASPGSLAHPGHATVRLLLRPGRKYEEAVEQFQPYNRLQDPYPEGRTAVARLMGRVAKREPGVPRVVYVYVNNRFEGSALLTIDAILPPGRSASPALPLPAAAQVATDAGGSFDSSSVGPGL